MAQVVPSSHLGLLRLGWSSDCDPLQVLDGVGAVGPAVGADDALVHSSSRTVNRISKILSGGQHQGEENQHRKCELEMYVVVVLISVNCDTL